MGSPWPTLFTTSKHCFAYIASVRRAPAQVDESYVSESVFSWVVNKAEDVWGHSSLECLGITRSPFGYLFWFPNYISQLDRAKPVGGMCQQLRWYIHTKLCYDFALRFILHLSLLACIHASLITSHRFTHFSLHSLNVHSLILHVFSFSIIHSLTLILHFLLFTYAYSFYFYTQQLS